MSRPTTKSKIPNRKVTSEDVGRAEQKCREAMLRLQDLEEMNSMIFAENREKDASIVKLTEELYKLADANDAEACFLQTELENIREDHRHKKLSIESEMDNLNMKHERLR